MEIIILSFMALVVVMCIFTVSVVVRDMLRERKNKYTQHYIQQSVVTVEQQEKPTSQEPVVEIPLAEYEGQIRFSADPKQSHKAKYLALDSEQRAWYSEIAEYANSIDDVKYVATKGYDEYRLYGKRIIRLRIKRNTVICEFIIANFYFSRYVSANKVALKQAASSFKLQSAKDVGVAKDSIDIAVRAIREEKEETKRQQRQRRRLARQAAAASHAVAITSTDEG